MPTAPRAISPSTCRRSSCRSIIRSRRGIRSRPRRKTRTARRAGPRPARAFGGNPRKIGVAGHDAGGQLANCLAFIARDRGEIRIAAQALIGPMLDPSLTRLADAARVASSDITAQECAACYRAYLPQPSQRMHPYAAPLESVRLAGLPPTLVATAQNDVLHVEAEKYASCLIDAGVPTQVVRYRDVSHAALADHAPALEEAARFFQSRFSTGSPG